MLEAGAEIRFIQALLGHALSTTEVYTQVSIGKLKAVHTATHPARLQARQATNADAAAAGPREEAGGAGQASGVGVEGLGVPRADMSNRNDGWRRVTDEAAPFVGSVDMFSPVLDVRGGCAW